MVMNRRGSGIRRCSRVRIRLSLQFGLRNSRRAGICGSLRRGGLSGASGSGSLGAREVEDLRDLIEMGELGSAFELLCRQLHEYEAAVKPRMLESLRKVGIALQLDARQCEILRVSESGR